MPATVIEFTIPYAVRPKQGDRSHVVTDSHGNQFVAHHPDPKVKANAESLAALVAAHRPAEPLAGPLALELTFIFPWRKSESQRIRDRWGLRPKDTKPDWDNLSKQLCDVLERAGFFTNDSQLADVRVRKFWGSQTDCQVRLWTLDADRDGGER